MNDEGCRGLVETVLQEADVYIPLGGDKGNAEEQDKKDLDVEKGGHCRPLETHDS